MRHADGVIASQEQGRRFLITPDSTDAPDLYFDLSLAPDDFWTYVRTDGGDIRVYKEDGATQLPREVSGFDYEGQVGSLFFPTSGATAFMIEYGSGQPEPAADSTYGSRAVWESAAKLIAHMEDANDSTANQKHGTPSPGSPPYVAGQIAKAGSFDGSHLIDFGDFGNMPAAGTISMWVTATNMSRSSYPGLMTTNKTGSNQAFRIEQDRANLYLYDGVAFHNFTTSLAQNVKHLLTFTWNVGANTVTTYYDGQPVSSGAGNFQATIPELVIGYGTSYMNRSWFGLIDEFRVYSRALSADEIAAIYANQSDCEAFWTFPALTGVNSLYTMKVGESLTITPSGTGLDGAWYSCTDGARWDSGTHTWSFTPEFSDGGTIETFTLYYTNGLVTVSKVVTVVVFRDWSALVQSEANPIIPYTAGPVGSWGTDTPFLREDQKIGSTYYAVMQSWVSSANWDKFYLYSSTDKINWTLHSETPVMTAATLGTSAIIILHPSIIKVGELWHCYFSAQPDWSWTGAAIWLMTSPDLVNWTLYGTTPVYTGNPGGAGKASLPCVLQVGNKLRMYTWTMNQVAGNVDQEYAESDIDDGITWTYEGVSQRRIASDWDYDTTYSRYDPWIIRNTRGFFEAVYTVGYVPPPSYNQKLGYCVSVDGVTWYDYQEAILVGDGIEGSFNERWPGDGCLLESGGVLYLYYAGEGTISHISVGVASLSP